MILYYTGGRGGKPKNDFILCDVGGGGGGLDGIGPPRIVVSAV